jgi:hypothetical protein
MEPLIVLADLGRIRVLRIVTRAGGLQAEQHLVEGVDSPVEFENRKLGEVVSDQAGRFAQGSRVGRTAGMSRGEEHNLEAELERRELHRVAAAIGTAVEEEGNPPWRLVAPQAILHQLRDALPAGCRKTLASSEGADLTKMPLADLEERLLGEG